MASRTRDKLIEAAKQLFIRNGVDNTTISDIANASDKGRRTIYTYFKNKREIYKAVIEKESDKMVAELKEVTDSPSSAADKLRQFINLRISQSKIPSSPYATIKSLISIDFGRSEKARRKAFEKEETILNNIIAEGVASGEFDKQKAVKLKTFLYPLIKLFDLSAANEESTQIFNGSLASNLTDYILDTLLVAQEN